MVSAEFAAAMPAVVLVLALTLMTARAGIDQIRCIDAARAGARAAARGDDAASVAQAVRRTAPDGASVAVTREGGDVVVTVTPPAATGIPIVGGIPVPPARAVAVAEGGS